MGAVHPEVEQLAHVPEVGHHDGSGRAPVEPRHIWEFTERDPENVGSVALGIGSPGNVGSFALGIGSLGNVRSCVS